WGPPDDPPEPGPADNGWGEAGEAGAADQVPGYVSDFAGYAPQPAYPLYPSYPGSPGGPARAPETSGRAIAVMVLGITAIALCWAGLIPAIVAVAMSSRAQREIEESGGRLTGLGMISAGRITSWIAIGLSGALAVVVLVAVLVGSSTSGSGGGPL